MTHEIPPQSSFETPQPTPSEAAAQVAGAEALPKAYDPSIIEQRWAEYWVRERCFEVPSPAATAVGEEDPFVMLLPPPNVTGRLHMGHMLNQTEMDILTRWHRMRGETALWVPGTDHAGIATQMMVERQLASEGTDRKTLGREAFTARVWEWKQKYGSAITDQMKRLGASVDWTREYFTMDDGLSVAVREAFVRLYEQGLIYRGAYIVNWDPVLQSAVSDLEVESEERVGKLYQIRYPFAGAAVPFDASNSIVIATTRPETMLGDVAVAVNPGDERYRQIVGTMLQLPLTGREISILADDWANPEFGTGAVKVTPAHDPNDFAIGQRHGLPSLSILDKTARVDLPGSPFHGLDRYEARERIVAELDSMGLLVEVKDHPMTVPVSQRSGAVIEPRLSDQWFLAVNKTPASGGESISAKAVAAVQSSANPDGPIRFTPSMYEKTYFEWMANIHDWCISRQLWWGHRIPAWHCNACGKITVSRETPGACSGCGITDIRQDKDVLDTWFSSGLLPFTVFGWPGEQGSGAADHSLAPRAYSSTPDLQAFYPTSLLVTGFDILFFWVARMIMLGTHFMLDVPMPDGSPRTLAEAVPFREVYIHALVRDANRGKMSKTKGNVIDPIEIIERFGTDAVRFTLASMASPGTDIAFSAARTEGNRAFANKIWNAARFLFMNLERARQSGIDVTLPGTNPRGPSFPVSSERVDYRADARPSSSAAAQLPLESRWILTRLCATCASVDASLAAYRFDEAASAVYQFFWGDLCDWYLEIVKLRLVFDSPAAQPSTAAALNTLVDVFESALRLLSPFMPFLTEEIWHALYRNMAPAKSIALTQYPRASDYSADPASVSAMRTMQEIVTAIRAIRKELEVPEKEAAPISIYAASQEVTSLASENAGVLARMARVASVEVAAQPLAGNNARSTASFDVAVLYRRQADAAAERERLTKELARYEKALAAAERQLSNEAFMAKAPAHIVEGLRQQAAGTRVLFEKTKAQLDGLG